MDWTAEHYNARLFGPGIRGWLHRARFRWLAAVYNARCQDAPKVLELGCFDGKALDALWPEPSRYLGLDANWEGGLDIALTRWSECEWAAFRPCKLPSEFPTEEDFDVAICMETLEHLEDDVLDGYLDRLASVTTRCGFITVPNEIGPVCGVKQTVKKLYLGGSMFRWSDVWNATLTRTGRIAREEHRGFDYRKLITRLRESFRVVSVTGIPFPNLPPIMNLTVGIVVEPLARERAVRYRSQVA